ncbi:MAG TPA: bifunctional tRNA (5-methylaminomethyl-2-thiouridine)(34)-methyltransferase MnmD/FAD-dependent 5-carboxymethylaminomethyl-2-thiouridine(34) oxidoreductase MnmC, partial [Pseudomonadales bacterium]
AFDDPYFSRDDGPAETDHVFVAGNALAQRFATLPARAQFAIGETGFGTGLNFLRACQCFLNHAPADARLHFISTEKHPLSHSDLARALQCWPDAALGRDLLAQWPAATAGFHRRQFADGRISLTLLQGDSTAMLRQLRYPVDAWFLDGFAPARNPDMWQPTLFNELARLSRPGTTLATFTSAGFVRRGLLEAGFAVHRVPGFGRKREMLTGAIAGVWQPRHCPIPSVIVVGAGLAGASSARALAEQGVEVTVLDPQGIANAASGNLAGVVYTTPSAHPTAQNRFYQSSYLHALNWLQRQQFPSNPADGALSGVLQYPKDARLAEKATAALASGLWPDSELAAADGPDGSLHLRNGGYLSPPRWCRQLLDHPRIRLLAERALSLQFAERWQVVTDHGSHRADHIILANAGAALSLASIPALKLKQIRGQVSYVRATATSRPWQQAICHAGYLTPALDNLHCVGATFDLHDHSPQPRDDDDQRNLDELRQHLPDHWHALGGERAEVIDRRVGFRCQSTDFLPLAGALPEQPAGLWMSVAHGSRGITGTPLCADLLAAQILDMPAPIDQEMIDALSPARFMLRQSQRQRSSA